MSIIAKYLRKNLTAKPLRTLLLIVCITCCSFVAILSMDMVGNLEVLMKTMLMQITGTTDIIIGDYVGVEDAFTIPYDNRQLLIKETAQNTVTRTEEFYSYFHKESFTVMSMDYELAYEMRLLGEQIALADGEAAVSSHLAEESGWKVGDEVTLYDVQKNPCPCKITTVLSNVGIVNGADIVLVGEDTYAKLVEHPLATSIYVDILEDDEIDEACAFLKELEYNGTVESLLDKNETRAMINAFATMFFMVFAVCFFLVIFVVYSVSSRIVCERMSVVGTFRSLGFSPALCTKLLLLEHALYGLLGSLVAIFLYLAGRDAIFNSIFTVEAGNFEVVINPEPLHPFIVVGILLLGVFVMCACPLKEILSSSKMAIRDIIFNNKDTAYQSHKSTLGVGILCAAAAGITFFMKGCVAAQIVCFIGIILAIALLFPWILKVLTGLFAKLFARLGMPVAHMAAVESYARKSTVGGAVLGVTASTLAIILFILVSTLGSVYDLKTFDCDVHASLGKQTDAATLSYIKDLDGVEETEILYKYETDMQFNGTEKTVTIFGLNEGGFSMFTGIANCPAKLEPDSFLMDESLAKRVGLEVGDTVEVMFDAYSYLPVTKKLKLAGLVDAYNYDTTGDVVVLPKDLYIDMYHDYPGEVLVRCENPQQIVEEIKKYSGTVFDVIETVEDYNLGWEEKEKGMRGMLYAVIIFGVGLTVIGMISNQLIGFEGRKRECAVLASTSMTRGTLSKMLLLESMIAAGIALVSAFPCALLAFVPFRRIMESLSAEFRVVYHLGAYGLFLGILWLVFTLVALFPVRSLRKMNLAEQLKYE